MPGELRVDIRTKDEFALDVAFEAPPGVTVLFGPSGSGKSTTLAAVAGLTKPSSGRITIGDDVWFDSKAKSTSRSTIVTSPSSSSRSPSSLT